MHTTVKAVRDALPSDARERSTRVGLLHFVAAAIIYAISFVVITLPSSLIARLLLAILNGLAIGILFIVGHDACHGSLTARPALNKWLGRVAFLPSLHPYSAWEYSHNALHHGWTNLRGKDPVYCPRTLSEFHALSPFRQRLERAYRSWLGMLPLYLCTIWWPLEIRPNAGHRMHIDKRGTFLFDRAIVVAFPFVQALVFVGVGAARGMSVLEIAGLCVVGLTVPFLAFNWLIGFATFQHHTHPRVLWYRDEAEWSFFRAQVQSTVHVEFPPWLDRLLNNIMQHTAHHVDTRVPLYHLTNAQAALEEAFGEEHVITESFSFAGMSDTFRRCQLYDFDQHCWLTFDGCPTTAPRSLTEDAEEAPRRVALIA
jgi:acyl-lipid omega-6 desaturase (Delta-12 desaturase)